MKSYEKAKAVDGLLDFEVEWIVWDKETENLCLVKVSEVL